MTLQTREYEFDAAANQTFSDLAHKMRWVGYFQLALGVLVGLFGILTLLHLNPVPLLQAIVMAFIGIWTLNASRGFSKIVETTGSDIRHLMEACGDLRKLYTLQYWLMIVSVVLFLIAIGVAILLGGLAAIGSLKG